MIRKFSLKDPKQESQLVASRIYVAGILIFLLIVSLIGRIFYLQVVQHDHFTTLSQDNRVQIRPLPPTRGLIFSSDNVLLADNRPSFNLELTPEKITVGFDELISELRDYIRIDEVDIRRYQELTKKKRRFESVPLRLNLNDEEVARVSVNRHLFEGVDVVAGLSRYYPIGPNLAHVIGYVSRIDREALAALDSSEYSGTTHIGKLGVEKAYEDTLHGKVGYEQVEVNVQGRVIRTLETTTPEPGKNVHLTLDVSLHNLAMAEMSGKRGAIVAIDTRSGGILTLVSSPGYDPNLFVNGIDSVSYKKLLDSSDTPLVNRALQGTYPPASTIKPILALAALNYEIRLPEDESFCNGYYRIPGSKDQKRCWRYKQHGHGDLNMTQAIAQSCDVYFYILAYDMGINRLHTAMAEFGFGRRTGIDIGGEYKGLNPSPEWKRGARAEGWYNGDTVNLGVGQGDMLVTPIQLAVATATIANRGVIVKPHLIAEIRDPVTGKVITRPEFKSDHTVHVNNPEYWDIIINAMHEVVQGSRGTALASAKGAKYNYAGKTGTAQRFSVPDDVDLKLNGLPEELQDNAVFVAFAPLENPEIAISVIVENGGGGSSTAAPIARHLLDHWFGITH